MEDAQIQRIPSLSSIPSSLGAASLSCLAAEHRQIRDQQSLDAWRTKALHTIDELYEQKVSYIRHEAHTSVLLSQLRAIIDGEIPHHENGSLINEHHIQINEDH